MIFLLVSFSSSCPCSAACPLWRLWSALPDHNIDFELVATDLDLERRS